MIRPVRLLRKCILRLLELKIYCHRLAPYLVGKIHLQKSSICGTRLLDHIKAQMVKRLTLANVFLCQLCTEKLHLFDCKYEKKLSALGSLSAISHYPNFVLFLHD